MDCSVKEHRHLIAKTTNLHFYLVDNYSIPFKNQSYLNYLRILIELAKFH